MGRVALHERATARALGDMTNMTINTSHAVRAQRHEPKDSLDFFGTNPWATRALIEHVMEPLGLFDAHDRVWEPACGQGHMVRALREYYGTSVKASDIHDYMGNTVSPIKGFFVSDFLSDAAHEQVDWVITNPPFNLLQPFIDRALEVSRKGVAIFGPLTMLETVGRYESIFRPYEGRFTIAPFVERCPTNKGAPKKNATTASAYAWLLICHDRAMRPLIHIPPCRKRLELNGDYPADPQRKGEVLR